MRGVRSIRVIDKVFFSFLGVECVVEVKVIGYSDEATIEILEYYC